MGYTLQFGSQEFSVTYNLDPFFSKAFEGFPATNPDSSESSGEWWKPDGGGSRDHGLWCLNDKPREKQIRLLETAITRLADIPPDDSWGGGEGGARKMLIRMLEMSKEEDNVWHRCYW